ncbi:hypothetical protein [Kocuria sp. NPDC057446]|uniref:hypothetical protein n=1 Tax=Kocuria sp. NPDC057446 TaxID=3346137 RepID=UPI0036C7FB2E
MSKDITITVTVHGGEATVGSEGSSGTSAGSLVGGALAPQDVGFPDEGSLGPGDSGADVPADVGTLGASGHTGSSGGGSAAAGDFDVPLSLEQLAGSADAGSAIGSAAGGGGDSPLPIGDLEGDVDAGGPDEPEDVGAPEA